MATRLYAAFERKKGERRWTRVHPQTALPRSYAISAYQSWLLDSALGRVPNVERTLRPVKNAQGESA